MSVQQLTRRSPPLHPNLLPKGSSVNKGNKTITDKHSVFHTHARFQDAASTLPGGLEISGAPQALGWHCSSPLVPGGRAGCPRAVPSTREVSVSPAGQRVMPSSTAPAWDLPLSHAALGSTAGCPHGADPNPKHQHGIL